MAIVVLRGKITKDQISKALEEHGNYMKITANIKQNIVAIGGEFHADAEKVLIDKYGSMRTNIWGGGYDVERKVFQTNARINIRPGENDSVEILDPVIRSTFVKLVKPKLEGIDA